MSEIKPLDETPAHRTRRVLAHLRVPESSAIVWLGFLVGVVAAGLIVIGFLVGGPASEMIQGYVDKLRELWTEP